MNFQRSKMNQAVVAAIVSMTAGHAAAEQGVIEEVVVTASKRSASMQDIPIAVQAMTENTLKEQNITSFEDYIKYLPSVNAGGRGPGQNEIYIRGAAVDAINITVAESQGSAPNVALYLDEQPVTAGGRNLDVYITDMERIEVLPGPQGTLYGASSQAGTVRLITNKPAIDEFAASVSADVSTTASGEPSDKVEAMINIPVIEGKLAVRAAVYSDNKGGYIDNIEGTFTANPALNPTFPSREGVTFAAGHVFANGTVVGEDGVTIPVTYATASSSGLVEKDFNDASYQGVRLGAKYLINDDWSALVQFTQQTLKTQGVFDYDEALGDLKVARFTEDSLEDEFSQFAWTIEGRAGALDLLYTGAYLDREVSQRMDYTGYTNIGASISGYQCEYIAGSFYHGLTDVTAYSFDPTISGNTAVIECGNPANNYNAENENTRMTHEFRVSTDPDNALRFVGGVFYEDSEILHIGNFNYLAPLEAGFTPIDINLKSGLDGADANARGLVNAATQFRNDNHRNEEQFAVFGEVSYDLMENVSVAASARYYDLEYGFTGYGAWRYGNRPLFVDDADPSNDVVPNVTGGRDYGTQFNVLQPLNTTDTITKLTVTWTPTDDLLLYVTSSEGYRPPGFNRGAAKEAAYTPGTECAEIIKPVHATNGFPGYCLPYKFDSDTLENLELGWKATLLDGKMRLNGSLYRIDWEDIQVSQFDSQNISIFTIVDNGGDAEINGLEMDMVWAINDNLSLFGAMSYNDTELVRVDDGFSFVVQDQGRPLPLTPKLQGNLRARYYWNVSGGNEAFWQVGAKYSDEALNSIVDTATEPNTMQDSYVIMDASIGLTTDTGLGVEVYVENLTDERAQLHINRQDFFERTTTNRPRTIGMRFSYDFNQ